MVCGGPVSAQWSGCFNPFSLPLYTLMGIIPDRGNTMNQQKLNSGMLFVYVYSICAYFHTWGSWWVHFFCVFLCQKQVENCVHTTVESPSLMLIKCEPVYCRNGRYSVILLFVKPNQRFTVVLFNIDAYQNVVSWLPRRHFWASQAPLSHAPMMMLRTAVYSVDLNTHMIMKM